jgi:hypothetical protein
MRRSIVESLDNLIDVADGNSVDVNFIHLPHDVMLCDPFVLFFSGYSHSILLVQFLFGFFRKLVFG